MNKENNLNQYSSYTSNTPLKYIDVQSSVVEPTMRTSLVLNPSMLPKFDLSQMFPIFPIDTKNSTDELEIKPTKIGDLNSWILAAPTVLVQKRETIEEDNTEDKEELIDIPVEDDSNETQLFKREIIKPEQQPPVQVHIQNITEVSMVPSPTSDLLFLISAISIG